MGVARVFALHEDAIAAKDRRSTVTLFNLSVLKIDLGEDAEAADDAGDRVPVHLHQPLGLGQHRFHWFSRNGHNPTPQKTHVVTNLLVTSGNESIRYYVAPALINTFVADSRW